MKAGSIKKKNRKIDANIDTVSAYGGLVGKEAAVKNFHGDE